MYIEDVFFIAFWLTSSSQISEHMERLVQLIKGDEPPAAEAPNEEEEYDALPTDSLPPETRLIQGLGFPGGGDLNTLVQKQLGISSVKDVEEEEEAAIEPLGADSDDDDDKIVEV